MALRGCTFLSSTEEAANEQSALKGSAQSEKEQEKLLKHLSRVAPWLVLIPR